LVERSGNNPVNIANREWTERGLAVISIKADIERVKVMHAKAFDRYCAECRVDSLINE